MGSRRRAHGPAPDGFVVGEESALANWIDAGVPVPVFRPDKGVPLRIARRPALIHNTETLAHIGLIGRYGSAPFQARGTPQEPGTCLVTLSGAVAQQGVVEVDRGTPLHEIVALGGPTEPLQALLVGGYGGAWIGPEYFATPYTHSALRSVGGTLGVGVIVALGQSACGIAESARIARYLASQSAGQCGPCVYGLPAVADDLARLASGHADAGLVSRLNRRLNQVKGRGACRHPDGAVAMAQSALHVFANDVALHARIESVHTCSRRARSDFPIRLAGEVSRLRISINPAVCDAYGYCAELLPEVIVLDEWGYPIVDPRPLANGLVETAKRAVRDCPKRAIELRASSGDH